MTFQKPVIYNLQNDADAKRFDLDTWERDYLMTRCFKNRYFGGVQGSIKCLVAHIQDGVTKGSLDWWVHNTGSSANILTTQAGEIVRCIQDQHAPYTNGDVNNPDAAAQRITKLGGNANLWSWTCEAEGTAWSAFTPQHWNAICYAFDEQLSKHPELDPRKDILGHRDFNPSGKPNCGLYAEKLIAELAGDHRPSLDTLGTITYFASPIDVIVTASKGLNLRKWGQLDQPIITTVPGGTVLTAIAKVVGDTVEGISGWYIDSKGRRFWSGGTNLPA